MWFLTGLPEQPGRPVREAAPCHRRRHGGDGDRSRRSSTPRRTRPPHQHPRGHPATAVGSVSSSPTTSCATSSGSPARSRCLPGLGPPCGGCGRRGRRPASSSREAPAPETSLDRMVGPGRNLALIRTTLDQVKQVAHAHAATVNDVLLAVTAGGLRALLRSRGEPVEDTTVRIYVPVSLRRRGRGPQQGNLIAQMVVPLPLGVADPGRRLGQIAAETARRKARTRTSLGTLFRRPDRQAAAAEGRDPSAGERDQRQHPRSRGAAVPCRGAGAGGVPGAAPHRQRTPRGGRAVVRGNVQHRCRRRPGRLPRPRRLRGGRRARSCTHSACRHPTPTSIRPTGDDGDPCQSLQELSGAGQESRCRSETCPSSSRSSDAATRWCSCTAGPGADHYVDAAVPALRGPVHPGLLRPSLQRTVDGRSRLVHDLGEPDGGRRRAAPAAGLRAVGRAGPLLRRPRGPRVRAALSRQPVAPGAAGHRRRQPLGAAERARAPRRARLQPRDGGAGPALVQRRVRAEGVVPDLPADRQARTTTTPASWPLLARACSGASGARRSGRRR